MKNSLQKLLDLKRRTSIFNIFNIFNILNIFQYFPSHFPSAKIIFFQKQKGPLVPNVCLNHNNLTKTTKILATAFMQHVKLDFC